MARSLWWKNANAMLGLRHEAQAHVHHAWMMVFHRACIMARLAKPGAHLPTRREAVGVAGPGTLRPLCPSLGALLPLGRLAPLRALPSRRGLMADTIPRSSWMISAVEAISAKKRHGRL
jgi:hypothetical protein